MNPLNLFKKDEPIDDSRYVMEMVLPYSAKFAAMRRPTVNDVLVSMAVPKGAFITAMVARCLLLDSQTVKFSEVAAMDWEDYVPLRDWMNDRLERKKP